MRQMVLCGPRIGSNYQAQGLKLSKYSRVLRAILPHLIQFGCVTRIGTMAGPFGPQRRDFMLR